MKHKTGLHKKVSSIFDGASLPRELSAMGVNKSNVPVEAKDSDAVLKTSELSGQKAKLQNQQHASWGQVNRPLSKVDNEISEDKQDIGQKKKFLLMIGLLIVLVLILFFTFYKPGRKITPEAIKETALAEQAKGTQINWPDPGKWPADSRDPMVYNTSSPKANSGETLVIKGIVRPPGGRASVLIGTEILYQGDKFEDWIVKEILQDVVWLEKPDGQKKELRWN